MKTFIFYSAIVLMVIGCKPKAKVSRDERNMAFDCALDFAEVAFFEQNYKKAYLLTSKDCEETFEEFCRCIEKLHPKGFPSAVRATEYEPILGQEKINIFLYGGNGNEEFYYRLVMEGTCETSYKVFSLERAASPYPPSELRERLITIAPVIRFKNKQRRPPRDKREFRI